MKIARLEPYKFTVMDCCCETMRLSIEEWDGCVPHIRYKYEDAEGEEFYIYGCDDNMPEPIKFCPWCGTKL